MTPTSHLLRARWVFPVCGPPIEDGVVEIASGSIVRLGSGREAEAVDLGDAAIIPGLVNAHTHLEFSDLDRPLGPARPFADWIRAVIAYRRNSSVDVGSALRRGLEEIQTSGTTLVGEIATSPASRESLQAADIPAVLFHEVLGLDEGAVDRHAGALADHFASCDGRQVRPGISPHAPYSVHPDLFQWTVDMAVERDAVVAMHLAETREELELLQHGTGPLVELLRSLGVWRAGVIPPGSTIGDYLEVLSEADNVAVIHGNYLTSSEIDFLTQHPQFSVVYCPRTHTYFGHAEHPWQSLLERNVNVALGTDSRASNPDLNLWHEVLFLRQRFPVVRPATLLQMATANGARALGMEASAGTLQVGRAADLAVVALPDQTQGLAADERLLHPESRIVRTMHRGCWASPA